MTALNNLQDVTDVIRENRSNESNFETMYQCLQQAIVTAKSQNNPQLQESLEEVLEKYAAEYRKARETRSSAWPEFEKFVTQFERSIAGS